MVVLSNIVQVLYRPRIFFEDIKEDIYWKDGVVVFTFSLFSALIMYSMFALSIGTTVILFPFGLGTSLALLPLLSSFLISFFLLLAGSLIAGFFAKALGGNGYFTDLLGMFGYSEFLAVPRSLASILLSFVLLLRLDSLAVDFAGVSTFVWPLLFFSLLFFLWEIWIKAHAVSIEYNISLFKGIISSVIAVLILTFINTGFAYLIL